jgi:hypothetical protein
MTLEQAAAAEDAWRPETRPDIVVPPGRWGAEPYPAAEFLALLCLALGVPWWQDPAVRPVFCDVGAGVGTKVLLAQAHGCRAWGIEAVPEYQAAAAKLGADVRLGEAEDQDYAGADVVFLNCLYWTAADQGRLEALVQDRMRPWSVLIQVNHTGPPAGWPVLLDEPDRWRGVYVKPALVADAPVPD